MKKIDYALKYANFGCKVFPCGDNDKIPRIKAWQQVATDDLATVRMWWSQYPDANVGIHVGASGLLVVDIDSDIELPIEDPKKALLPDTFVVQTRAGGRHYYYTVSEGVPACVLANSQSGSARALAPSVDTRGLGGYVLAEGSTVPTSSTGTGVYEVIMDAEPAPLPQWIVDHFLSHDRKARELEAERQAKASIRKAIDDGYSSIEVARRLIFENPNFHPVPTGTGEGDNRLFEAACIAVRADCSESEMRQVLTEYDAVVGNCHGPRRIEHKIKQAEKAAGHSRGLYRQQTDEWRREHALRDLPPLDMDALGEMLSSIDDAGIKKAATEVTALTTTKRGEIHVPPPQAEAPPAAVQSVAGVTNAGKPNRRTLPMSREDHASEALLLRVRSFSPWHEAYCAWVESQSVYRQPGLIAASCIMAQATMAQRRFVTPSGLGAHLWAVSLGKSGEGKSTPLACLKAFIEAVYRDKMCISENFTSKEAFFEDIRCSSVQGQGMLFAVDEYSTPLKALCTPKGFLFQQRGQLMAAFSASKIKLTHSLAQRRETGRTETIINGASFCIYGTAPKAATFRALVDGSDGEDGFLARHLYFSAMSVLPYARMVERMDPPAELVQMGQAIRDAHEAWHAASRPIGATTSTGECLREYQPEVVPWGEGAEDRYMEHTERWDEAHRQRGEGSNGSIMRRIGEMALKIALATSVVSSAGMKPCISKAGIDFGFAVAEYSAGIAQDAITEVSDPARMTHGEAREWVLGHLRHLTRDLHPVEGGKITEKAIVSRCKAMPGERLLEILWQMETEGLVEVPEKIKAKKEGMPVGRGRLPAPTWRLIQADDTWVPGPDDLD